MFKEMQINLPEIMTSLKCSAAICAFLPVKNNNQIKMDSNPTITSERAWPCLYTFLNKLLLLIATTSDKDHIFSLNLTPNFGILKIKQRRKHG